MLCWILACHLAFPGGRALDVHGPDFLIVEWLALVSLLILLLQTAAIPYSHIVITAGTSDQKLIFPRDPQLLSGTSVGEILDLKKLAVF